MYQTDSSNKQHVEKVHIFSNQSQCMYSSDVCISQTDYFSTHSVTKTLYTKITSTVCDSSFFRSSTTPSPEETCTTSLITVAPLPPDDADADLSPPCVYVGAGPSAGDAVAVFVAGAAWWDPLPPEPRLCFVVGVWVVESVRKHTVSVCLLECVHV